MYSNLEHVFQMPLLLFGIVRVGNDDIVLHRYHATHAARDDGGLAHFRLRPGSAAQMHSAQVVGLYLDIKPA